MSLEASGEAGLEAEGEVAGREFILKVSPIIKLSNYPLQPASVLQGWDKIIGEILSEQEAFAQHQAKTILVNFFCPFPCFQSKAIKPKGNFQKRFSGICPLRGSPPPLTGKIRLNGFESVPKVRLFLSKKGGN